MEPGETHARAGETGWLAGRVVGPDGRALQGATVQWMGWMEAAHRTRTVTATAEGSFQLGPLPTRPDHVLWVDAPGHARLRVGDHQVAQVAVIPGVMNDLGEIALAPEAVATGRLVDEAGAPIAGATIECVQLYHSGAGTLNGNGPAIALATGTDGVFHIGSLPIGQVRLTLRVPDHPLLYRSLRIRGDVDLGDIRVVRERRRVRGRVVDPAGGPIGGVLVFVNGDEECSVRTDADGTFTLEARHHQIRSVSVDDDGNRITVSVDDADDVQVELEPARFLEGIVVDAETGAPIPIDVVSICEVRRREVDGTIHYVG